MSKRKKPKPTGSKRDRSDRGPAMIHLDETPNIKPSKGKKKSKQSKSKSSKISESKKTSKKSTNKQKSKKNTKTPKKQNSTDSNRGRSKSKNSAKKSKNDSAKNRAKSQAPKSNKKKSNKLTIDDNDSKKRAKSVSPKSPENKKNNNNKKNAFKESMRNIFGIKKKKKRGGSLESVQIGKNDNIDVKQDQDELDAFEEFIKSQKNKENKKNNKENEFDKNFDDEWDSHETKSPKSSKKHKKKKDGSKKKKDKSKKKKDKKLYGLSEQKSVRDVNKRNEFKANQAWHHKKRSSLPTYNDMRKRQATLQFHIDKERNRNLASLNYDTEKRKKSKEYKNLSNGGFQIRVNYRYRLRDRRIGICRFKGRTLFGKSYQDWIGIVVEYGEGEHDGTVQGKSYFKCRNGKGIMVLPQEIFDDLGSATKPITQDMIKKSGKIKTKEELKEMKRDKDGRWIADNYVEDHGGSLLSQKTFYNKSQLDVNAGKKAGKKKRYFEI